MSRRPRPTLAMHALDEEPDGAAAICRDEGIGMEITTFAHPTNRDEGSDHDPCEGAGRPSRTTPRVGDGIRNHHLDQRFGQVHLPHALHAHPGT